jgi:hypothetical protein
MLDTTALKYNDRTYFIEYEREAADYSVGYKGDCFLVSVTTEDGRELKNLINSNIQEAILEQIQL